MSPGSGAPHYVLLAHPDFGSYLRLALYVCNFSWKFILPLPSKFVYPDTYYKKCSPGTVFRLFTNLLNVSTQYSFFRRLKFTFLFVFHAGLILIRTKNKLLSSLFSASGHCSLTDFFQDQYTRLFQLTVSDLYVSVNLFLDTRQKLQITQSFYFLSPCFQKYWSYFIWKIKIFIASQSFVLLNGRNQHFHFGVNLSFDSTSMNSFFNFTET